MYVYEFCSTHSMDRIPIYLKPKSSSPIFIPVSSKVIAKYKMRKIDKWYLDFKAIAYIVTLQPE